MFGFSSLSFLSLSCAILSVISAPALDGLSSKARAVLERATPAAPHWVIYSDKYAGTSLPDVSEVEGYNVYCLSFLLLEGAWDNADVWATFTADDRTSIKAEYAAAGIQIVVSAFGSTDVPTTSGADPTTSANTLAAWVIEYDLDGIDIDYEDFDAMNAGTAEAWLITFTTALRAQLPVGDYILTHAPVAPWFTPTLYPGGGYLYVNSEVGSLIDWYNVQFYNQGTTEYTDCAGLLTTSSTTWPETALFQIAANGVDSSKLVIGKPATTADATNGYITPDLLSQCLEEAKADGWDGGAMVWQYPDAAESWISTVRSLSWPL